MQLYYTTSAGYEQPQTVVAKSLGGYRSANIVKNDDFDNLFGEISAYTIREARDEYIALILRNTTGVQVDNVEAWFVPPTDSYGTFEIAGVTTTRDTDNNPIMERVRTKFTRPFVGTFVAAIESNRLSIGTMVANAEVGLWFKRAINRTTIDTTIATIYERDPSNTNLYREVVLNKQDSIVFTVNWIVIYRNITAAVTVVRNSATQVTYTFNVSTTEAVVNAIPVQLTIQNVNGNGGGLQSTVTIAQGQTSATDTVPVTNVNSAAYTATIAATVPTPHDVTVNQSVNIPVAQILTIVITAVRDSGNPIGINVTAVTTASVAPTADITAAINIRNRLGNNEDFNAAVNLSSGQTTTTSQFPGLGASASQYVITPIVISAPAGYEIVFDPTTINVPAL